MIVANPIGGKRLPQMSNPAAAADVVSGKQFILPDGSVGVGNGHILKTSSGNVSCGLNQEDITINTGLKTIVSFIMFKSYPSSTYGTRSTTAIYGGGIKICQVCTSNPLIETSGTTSAISINGGNVTIKGLHYTNHYSDLANIPWFAVGYTE